MESILVCLDGSPLGETGLGYALPIAQATGASLVLLAVVNSSPSPHRKPVDALAIEIARTDVAQYLRAVTEGLADQGQDIRTEIAEGRPADQILQTADREGVDLIVFTSHGTSAGSSFCLGSTAQKVAQHARQSLLLVRADVTAAASVKRPIERVLVLLDGSAAAESSLPHALALARTLATEVVLGYAAQRPVLPTREPPTRRDTELLERLVTRDLELARAYLRKVERTLRLEGAFCRMVTKECDSIRQGVLALAEQEQVDLILLTSHGHTSSERVIHGGIAQQVLIHANRPVWVVQNVHVAAVQSQPSKRREGLRRHECRSPPRGRLEI